ncbi:hypothetical protein EK599_22490 [Vibrio sp. T187]|uniref:hypothetical protein n=1 Tax=Vibrio TaxID=662 RepID=UPI0010C9620E|nr:MULTISPECIES: hypothetical protein [Vibrio]MBW3698449.1 hypothetical protein [Vibrio sp. T187]
MTQNELLERALYSSATIHQPHSLKAYLATCYLYHYLDQPEYIWTQTNQLIGESEIHVSSVFSEAIQAPKFPEFRIHRVLQRGIYPAAYQALYQWHDSKGFNDIFAHYVVEASNTREYLSHNVTILLALNCAYQHLEASHIPPFLDRFTEFVTSTYAGGESAITASTKDNLYDVELTEVLASCLQQFGFFGHNLITLAWVMRCKNSLSETQYTSMLANLNTQANSPLEDPDDEIDITTWQQCEEQTHEEDFNKAIHQLVFGYSANLHQVTLADALCFLKERFPDSTSTLTHIAHYQCRLLS